MSVIKQLDENLANKIAAGEVVEKCASVVKELVENSIDAKSTEISIDLLESGVKEIKVTDNGVGMDSDDALICFSRHATSKIKNEKDLYHINTLGFRGEALASIASVSKVVLITSQGDIGTTVKVTGGKVESVTKSDARKGTIISVNNLFYNTPARLKYLKSLYTELANIVDLINKIALSHPEVRFTLTNDKKVLLKTDGSNNQLKVINAIYGLEVTKGMQYIENSNSDYIIKGYISKPEINKSSRNSMITIVNGRVVKNAELNRVINDSYHSYKPDNRYPIVVINIEVDDSLVDVNIHPTKQDIKFSNQNDLNDLIYDTIRKKLSEKTLIPNASIIKNEETYKVEEKEKTVKHNYEEIKLDFDEVEVSIPVNDFVYEEEEKYEEVKELFPSMDIVGLVHGTYIIGQNENGMYIIDQHAAKERINYEFIKEKLGQTTCEAHNLLIPLTYEFSNNEFIILKENFEFIRNMNFEIDEFGLSSVIIKSHPIWVPAGNEVNAIRKFLELVIEKEKNFDLAKFNDSLAALMACKMSIKANTNITLEEMENLINDLRKCQNPFNCPHGRPTTIHYEKIELEKMFKRTGF